MCHSLVSLALRVLGVWGSGHAFCGPRELRCERKSAAKHERPFAQVTFYNRWDDGNYTMQLPPYVSSNPQTLLDTNSVR